MRSAVAEGGMKQRADGAVLGPELLPGCKSMTSTTQEESNQIPADTGTLQVTLFPSWARVS